MQTFLASLGLLICSLLLVRMVLRPQARERLDRVGRALRQRLQAFYERIARRMKRQRTPPVAQPDPKSARQIAEEAIRRARNGSAAPEGDWKGNVFHPRGVDWSGPPGDKSRDGSGDKTPD
jgi:uncharacterized membrane protein YccC